MYHFGDEGEGEMWIKRCWKGANVVLQATNIHHYLSMLLQQVFKDLLYTMESSSSIICTVITTLTLFKIPTDQIISLSLN